MYLRNLNSKHITVRILCILLTIFIVSFGAYHIANACPAEDSTAAAKELSFKSIPITSKDTLWSIASENYTEEYGSIKNYIEEIKRCNSLTSDTINAGSSLIVPVYISVVTSY